MAGLRRGPPQGPNFNDSQTMVVTPNGVRPPTPDEEDPQGLRRAALSQAYGFQNPANYSAATAQAMRRQPLRLNTPQDLNAAYGFDDPANWNYSVR